jgi:sulfate adenylyltransferase subunit 1 (EFTu-like GTPase family)
VPQITVCVNKMDLVGYAEERFDTVVREFLEFAAGAGLRDLTFIPVSALHGDNVVDRSEAMPWYAGEPLLAHLEGAPEAAGAADGPARLPIQYVIRHGDERHYAGRLASGTLRAGDEVVVLPSGARSRVARVLGPRGEAADAAAPASVSIVLEDEVDVGRGDMIARASEAPTPSRELAATLCWLGDAPARAGGTYLLKHTTRTVRAKLDAIEDRLDVTTFERAPAAELELNAIGRVRLRLGGELAADPYAISRATGAFILIDEATNDTVGAGMVDG